MSHGKRLPSETTKLSPTKAKIILEEGTANGKKINQKQRGFFGAVASKGERKS